MLYNFFSKTVYHAHCQAENKSSQEEQIVQEEQEQALLDIGVALPVEIYAVAEN